VVEYRYLQPKIVVHIELSKQRSERLCLSLRYFAEVDETKRIESVEQPTKSLVTARGQDPQSVKV